MMSEEINGDEVPLDAAFFSFENLAGVDSEDPLSNPSFNDDNETCSQRVTIEDSTKSYVTKGRKRNPGGKKCLIKVVQVRRKRKQLSTPNTTSSTQFQTKGEFIAEMDKVIEEVINESVFLLQKDPREYHPYYLRTYKYISLGQQSGFLGNSSKQVKSIWEKYDKLCGVKIANLEDKKPFFDGVESPYAAFIKTGKVIIHGKEIIQSRDLLEVNKRMEELEQVAKKIVEKWRKRRGRKKDIRRDIERRLEFFENCKTMTFPGDCVRMNNIWTQFLNHFESSSGPVVEKSVPEVKKEVLEEPVEDLDSFSPLFSTENQPVTVSEDDKMQIKPIKQFGKRHTALLNKPNGMSSTLKARRLQKLNGRTEKKRELQLEKALCSPSGPPPKKAKLSRAQPIPRKSSSSCITSKLAADDGPKLNKKISSLKTTKLTLSKKKPVFVSKLKKKWVVGFGSTTNKSLLNAKLEKVICLRKPLKKKPKPNETKQIESPEEEVADPVIAEMEQEDASMGPCMCEVCGEIYSSKQEILKHKETVHSQNIASSQENKILFPQAHEKRARSKNEAVPTNSINTEKGNINIPIKTKSSTCCCDICGKLFSSTCNLTRHITSKHSSEASTALCPHCGKTYKSKDAMMAHVREVHMGRVFRCDICGRNLQAAGKLWKHKVDVHSMNDLPPPPELCVFECHICKEKILRGIKQHMEKNHPGEDATSCYRIVNGKRETMDAAKLNLKTASNERKRLRRREERRRFKEEGIKRNRPALLKKPRKPRPPQKYDRFARLGKRLIPTACPQCGFIFDKKKNKLYLWEEHMREAHGITEKFACEVEGCSARCILESGLELHMKAKHLAEYLIKIEAVHETANMSGWNCMICSEIINRDEIDAHFNEKHQQTMEMLWTGIAPEKSLECTLCKEKASSENELRNHLKSCHPEDCLNCMECGRILTSNEELQEHFLIFHLPMEVIPLMVRKAIEKIRLIPEEKSDSRAGSNHLPFVCPICFARFSVHLELMTHAERNHSDEIFYCKECPTNPKLTERAYYSHLSYTSRGHSNQFSRKEMDPMLKKKIFYDWVINCELCEKDFKMCSFKSHLKNIHNLVENGKLFGCACLKQYTNRENWMTHMEELHGGKPEELFEIAKKINVTEDVDLDKYRKTEIRKKRTSKRTKKGKKGKQNPKKCPSRIPKKKATFLEEKICTQFSIIPCKVKLMRVN